MNFNWDDNTIKWYEDANEYTGFYKNIADLIAPKLEGYSTFCDIGCGLGLVDIELRTKIQNITCIDINEKAIEALKNKINDLKINNIETINKDWNEIDESWDVIYVSFFGGKNIEEFLPRCKQLFALVNKNGSDPFFEKYRTFNKSTCEEVKQVLDEKDIEYCLTEVSFEFGQPLVSIEDSRNYIRSYCPTISEEDLNEYLNKRLIKTNISSYPFYLPKKKSIGIFQIKGEND